MFPRTEAWANLLRFKLTNSNQEINMDKERFERGLAARKSVLGAEYVEKHWRRPTTLTVNFRNNSQSSVGVLAGETRL